VTALRPDAVVKVGGSLSRRPAALRRLMDALAALARRHLLVVVPGGGPFADAVRRVDLRFGLDDSSAHWMAILGMDQYAYLLSYLARDASVVWDRDEIASGRLNVLAVSSWLRRLDALPHSWHVTSDSIAAWVARRLRAKMLVLVKDVDGQFDRDPEVSAAARLARRASRTRLKGVVDRHFARAIRRGTPCWLVNGTHSARVVEVIETGRTYGTRVS
jgi:aspartokinase-like uncharacterized kinase